LIGRALDSEAVDHAGKYQKPKNLLSHAYAP
jgi:hypothetical protein